LKLAAQFVVACNSIDVMVESEYAQCTNVSANGNARVAFFKATMSLTRDAHSFGKQDGSNTSSPAGQAKTFA